MDRGDKAFDPTKEKPAVVACLIHPTRKEKEIFSVKEKEGFQTVVYGLCSFCCQKLKADPTYAVHIDKKICERLDNLKPQESENAEQV